jgi:acetylornithine deacetylase
MKTAIASAIAQIDTDRDEIVTFVQSLIKLQPAGEETVQAAVAERMRVAGAKIEALTYEPSTVPMIDEFASGTNVSVGERASIVGTFTGAKAGRSLILFAHPDGEPIGDTSNWDRDPFAGVIENGRIYGWGIADDLAGVAAAVSAMDAIKAAGIELAGEVIVASTPSKRHARGVSAVLHHGYKADAAIYLHPAESGVGMNEIKAFASGQLEFTIDVAGKLPDTTEPGHTAFAHRAINPLDKALLLIDALKALDEERSARVRHPLLDGAVGRSSNILISSLQFGQNKAFSRLPITLKFGGAVSFPPPEKLKDVQAEVEAALEEAIAADPWLSQNRPVLSWISGVTGMEVSDSHPLYQAVSSAVTEVAGYTPHVNPMHTSSDIRNPMIQKGIPTVGLGPYCGDLTQTGRHDEWVDLEDYIRLVKVAAASIISWCGVQ